MGQNNRPNGTINITNTVNNLTMRKFEMARKKERDRPRKENRNKQYTSIALIICDLFYASLICLKSDMNGKIMKTDWLEITKDPSKTRFLEEFKELNISEELWGKISGINLKLCKR